MNEGQHLALRFAVGEDRRIYIENETKGEDSCVNAYWKMKIIQIVIKRHIRG